MRDMINPQDAIEALKKQEFAILKTEKWLMYLAFTKENCQNMERIYSFEGIKENYVLSYVEKTLQIAQKSTLNEDLKNLLYEILKWNEVAKAGLKNQRQMWEEARFNLFAHNEGSAQIYKMEMEKSGKTEEREAQIVYTCIKTHGLIGQYIRGEVPFESSQPLYELVKNNLLEKQELQELLYVLNKCVIAAVDETIWILVKQQVKESIHLILENQKPKETSVEEKIKKLRANAILNGENFEEELKRLKLTKEEINLLENLFSHANLWYVEAALYDFNVEEFIKIFLMIASETQKNAYEHISFVDLMNQIYYQHDGKKRINIYKKRIIESYLKKVSREDILSGNIPQNMHVALRITEKSANRNTLFFDFVFSKAGSALIDFCVEAEKSGVMYEKAIVLLFDLFELRKDKYDRFYEEESYLETMNQTIDYKKIILDYIKGDTIVDIGPGGGALMDLIEVYVPDKKILGVDIAQNVLDSLKKKKRLENHNWDVCYGDALNLSKYMEPGSVDTIIFCSILHELFSYIEYNGKKFNYETLETALQSVFKTLPVGGRIIIRDGIMTEEKQEKRMIRFLSEEGMQFLKRYVADFKGRTISYEVIGQNEVVMPINDAMEFLYTYTWGEQSYVHEINEQFGYFTPAEYQKFVLNALQGKAKIIECRHFLQEGYTIALSQKIEFFDENRKKVSLPDSTCLLVIEKVNE